MSHSAYFCDGWYAFETLFAKKSDNDENIAFF